MPNMRKGQATRAVSRGQERQGPNPYDEKSTTRKKVDGPTIYQRELRRINPQYSQLPMSDMVLIRAAREGWACLNPSQREKYDIQAKQENAKILQQSGTTWQRDMLGRSLLSEQEKQQRRHKWEIRVEGDIERLVSGTREDVINKEFHLITVNTFLNTAGAKRPEDVYVILAEITLLSFSIKAGKTSRCSFFPAYGKIPTGHKADMIDSTEDHGIPVACESNIKTVDPTEVVRRLSRFAGESDGGVRPLFTRTADISSVRIGLSYIYGLIGIICPWDDAEGLGKIYPFEKLTAAMTNRGIDFSNDDPSYKIPLEHAIQTWTDMPTIQVGSECCEFHCTIDKSLACSQAQAMACLWWNLNYCAGYYNVNITDNHVNPVVREKNRRRFLAADEIESMGAAGDTANADWPDAPVVGANGSRVRGAGRGVTLEEPSPKSAGRGRGRGLRGRLPRNLD